MTSELEKLINEQHGPRCPTFDVDCPCCKIWAEYDTRAAPDVPELMRYVLHDRGDTIGVHEDDKGEYVRYDQAAAVFAAKDAEIAEGRRRKEGAIAAISEMHDLASSHAASAEAAEAKLAQIEKKEIIGIEWKDITAGDWEGTTALSCSTSWSGRSHYYLIEYRNRTAALIFRKLGGSELVAEITIEGSRYEDVVATLKYTATSHFKKLVGSLYTAPVASDVDLRAENERLRGVMQEIWDNNDITPSSTTHEVELSRHNIRMKIYYALNQSEPRT